LGRFKRITRKFGEALVDAIGFTINPVGSISGFAGGSDLDLSTINDGLREDRRNTQGDNKKNILYIGLGIVALIAVVFFVTKK